MCLYERDTSTACLNVPTSFGCGGPVLSASLSKVLSSNKFLAGNLQCPCVCLCLNVYEIEMWLFDYQSGGNMLMASCCSCLNISMSCMRITFNVVGASYIHFVRVKLRNVQDKISFPHTPEPRFIRWRFMSYLPTTIGFPATC